MPICDREWLPSNR
uniref:Uncharacterized protein n=1 Tax=Anopheles dirus TaxID=7168 RepID=A0A182NYA3_9DIPT